MPFRRLLRNLLLWLGPVLLTWWLLTPLYNRILTGATENLVRLSESPNHTTLATYETHYFLIYRNDLRGQTSTGHLSSVRVTDTQFPLILLAILFLAVPNLPLKRRLSSLGWATLVSVLFHVVSLFFWVKFVYATQLGDWSASHYGTLSQNFWGLGKHLLDLPFKFSLPLILWCLFFFDELLPREEAA